MADSLALVLLPLDGHAHVLDRDVDLQVGGEVALLAAHGAKLAFTIGLVLVFPAQVSLELFSLKID